MLNRIHPAEFSADLPLPTHCPAAQGLTPLTCFLLPQGEAQPSPGPTPNPTGLCSSPGLPLSGPLPGWPHLSCGASLNSLGRSHLSLPGFLSACPQQSCRLSPCQTEPLEWSRLGPAQGRPSSPRLPGASLFLPHREGKHMGVRRQASPGRRPGAASTQDSLRWPLAGLLRLALPS